MFFLKELANLTPFRHQIHLPIRRLQVNKLKETTGKAEALTRKIYLAGAGIFAINLETTKKQLKKSQSFFDKLVVRGEKLEAQAKEKIETSTDQFKKQYEKTVAKGKSTLSDMTDIETIKAKLDEYRTKATGYLKA